MGGDVKSMSIDQASQRVDFTEYMSPTYNPPETTGSIAEHLRNSGFNVEVAYPWTCLYEHPVFEDFIKNPLDKKCQSEVKSSGLSFNCMPNLYHMLIGYGDEEMKNID